MLLAGVMALSVVGAAVTLYALGWLLHKVLVAFPRRVAGLVGLTCFRSFHAVARQAFHQSREGTEKQLFSCPLCLW